MSLLQRIILLAGLCSTATVVAQPCVVGYTFTASTPPNNGTYSCGQTVTFCYTLNTWNTTNANWFQGIVASFGPGWDLSTLTPGTPPAEAGTIGGTWGWYNSVQGTAGTAIGPQGPGFFFDLDNDGNPGNNFGDFATGSWTFCWTISVLSGPACVNGLDLGVTINTFGDSETGSWGSTGCTGDPNVFSAPAVIQSCNANAGIGGPLTLCSSSPPANLFANLTGTPDAGGTWTTPSGTPHSGLFDPATDPAGAYIYTVGTVVPPCQSQSTITVTVNPQPDAGSDGAVALCASDAAVDLLTLLGGTPDPGGAWSGPSGATSSTLDPSTDPSGIYTYTIPAVAPCLQVSATVSVVVAPVPNAGADGAYTACSAGAPELLFTHLGGVPAPGGAWTTPGGLAFTGQFDPAVDPAGAYTYTVGTASPPCLASAVVTVSVSQQPDAGSDGNITLCSSSPPADLFSLLAGPDAGGSWTDPGGAAHSSSFDPLVDAAGVYTYTISAPLPCVDVSATVIVTVNPSSNAGGPGSITVCSDGASEALFDQLIGTPSVGGTWSDPSGAPTTGTFSPGSSTAGVYTYTVTGIAPCPSSSATVTVTQNIAPNAGIDAAATLCDSDGLATLTTLLNGLPQPGGTWTDAGGLVVANIFDLATGASGNYTYTVGGIAPCANAQSVLDLSIAQQPNAGNDNVLSLCEASAVADLFDALGGTPDAGGYWTDAFGLAASSSFDPGTDAPGVYTYTVDATAPCVNSTATVTVFVNPQPNAGADALLNACSSDADVTLFDELGAAAQLGGSWTDPDGNATTGTFNPGVSADGPYTYTISSVAPCVSSSAVVTMSTVQAGFPGVGTPSSFCSDGPPAPLDGALNGAPDPGGTWYFPGGTISSGTLDPGVDPSGAYTYTIAASGPCPAVSTVVQVTINAAPDAGTNGSVDLCSSLAIPYGLLSALGGTPAANGAWTDPLGQPHGNSFNAASDPPGSYTYTVSGAPPCMAATSLVDVDLVAAAVAGAGTNVSLCENDAPVDPFDWLTGTPDAGGTWTAPDATPLAILDPSTASSGVYTYTVTGAAPCPNAQASMNITIDVLPYAGADNSIALCANANTVDLLALLVDAEIGGTWTGPFGAAPPFFQPGTNAPGTYTYTVLGTGACLGTSDASTVIIDVNAVPTPSFSSSLMIGCAPLQVQFLNDDPASATSALWSFGNGYQESGITDVWNVYAEAGQYDVSLEVTDANGCVGITTVNEAITVSAGPDPQFYALPTRVSVNSPTTIVTQVPEDDVLYSWVIDGVTFDTTGTFPWTFVDPEIGLHPVCLTATDALGCSNTFCIDVLVDDDLTIFVANAFTPNGDEQNDTFRPSILGVQDDWYEFLVFDRWGLTVFSTTDPFETWDGSFQNAGEILPQDVYVWKLKAKDQFTPEKQELIGTVTLLK